MVFVGGETIFQVIQNLDSLNLDRFENPPEIGGPADARRDKIRKYILPEHLLATQGVYFEHDGKDRYDARGIYLMYSSAGKYEFEERRTLTSSAFRQTAIPKKQRRWRDCCMGYHPLTYLQDPSVTCWPPKPASSSNAKLIGI